MEATTNYSSVLNRERRKRKRLYKHMLVFSTKLDEALSNNLRMENELKKQAYEKFQK